MTPKEYAQSIFNQYYYMETEHFGEQLFNDKLIRFLAKQDIKNSIDALKSAYTLGYNNTVDFKATDVFSKAIKFYQSAIYEIDNLVREEIKLPKK